MILAVDIGNTNIVVGCIHGEEICFVERLSTVSTRTELEYAISFKNVLEMYGVSIEDLDGGIISSGDEHCEAFHGEDSESESDAHWAGCKDRTQCADGRSAPGGK